MALNGPAVDLLSVLEQDDRVALFAISRLDILNEVAQLPAHNLQRVRELLDLLIVEELENLNTVVDLFPLT